MLDGKLRHVEKEIGLRVEGEEGAVVVVGKKIVKKHVASIENYSKDLKKRMILVLSIYAQSLYKKRKRQVQNKEKKNTQLEDGLRFWSTLFPQETSFPFLVNGRKRDQSKSTGRTEMGG